MYKAVVRCPFNPESDVTLALCQFSSCRMARSLMPHKCWSKGMNLFTFCCTRHMTSQRDTSGIGLLPADYSSTCQLCQIG